MLVIVSHKNQSAFYALPNMYKDTGILLPASGAGPRFHTTLRKCEKYDDGLQDTQ